VAARPIDSPPTNLTCGFDCCPHSLFARHLIQLL